MVSVLTGDIIASTSIKPEVWLPILKNALKTSAKDDTKWEVYRGDSFQIEVPDIQKAFITSVYIKACIKTIKGLDVRMAIGVGDKTFSSNMVAESNGSAFQFSGETLEHLKKEKVNLKIKTEKNFLNRELNLYFKLALIAMDDWTVNSAEIIKLQLEHPEKTQADLAKIIGISQDAVSKRIKRSRFNEVIELNKLYSKKITSLNYT